MMTISGRELGRRKPLFEDFSVPFPPELGDGSTTLRQVIDRIVRHEVEAFRKRQSHRQLVRALTAKQIDEGVEAGKVLSGASDVEPQAIDDEEAVGAAVTAFEDGLFLVSVDDTECRELDQQVFLEPDSRVTFIRLALLAGG